MNYDEELLKKELKIKAIRSSGSGGQHVNKVSSKIELTLNINESKVFNTEQKKRLIEKLKSRLTKEKTLIIYCENTRSQHRNKEEAITRLFNIINTALLIPKSRKLTKIPRAIIKKRLKNKKLRSERKASRKRPKLD